jgi:hypothetical protein
MDIVSDLAGLAIEPLDIACTIHGYRLTLTPR